jgi:hypothetical protein
LGKTWLVTLGACNAQTHQNHHCNW